eukprot:CAMPEP_0168342592 /NCGR_PEP_ID=MMETSP0213-20121227/15495_1 /TAXON_ID=151035 /ORGANISM="Euplotes harpa, Strain FSP1.4" /LENGTH=94 /DNA_ID=CAMNT_0008349537 /DNA_START=16 /DNA_END=300 /DNA_ORIENTATION=+
MNPLETLRTKIDLLKQKRDQLRQEAEFEKTSLGQIENEISRMESERYVKLNEIKMKTDKKQQIQHLIMQSEQALSKMQQCATQLFRTMDEALNQ